MAPLAELPPFPEVGRCFTEARQVELGDVSPRGRLRLDGLARYVQDVAQHDARDGLGEGGGFWVVRRLGVDVVRFPRLGERLMLRTACSGIGSRWAERRTSITGDDAGQVEAVALWVHVDPTRGFPARLPARFAEVYGPAAQGRTVPGRLVHPDPPAEAARGQEAPFPLRIADFDVARHVNNAVYWQMVEEVAGPLTARLRAEVEHRRALGRGARPTLVLSRDEATGVRWLWVRDSPQASSVAASARVAPRSASTW